MKKVLHISKYYYPFRGGTEQIAQDCVNSLVGDYEQAFIFPKKLLRAFCVPSNKEIEFKEIMNGTALGYTFPIEYIERKCLCAKHILFRR